MGPWAGIPSCIVLVSAYREALDDARGGTGKGNKLLSPASAVRVSKLDLRFKVGGVKEEGEKVALPGVG